MSNNFHPTTTIASAPDPSFALRCEMDVNLFFFSTRADIRMRSFPISVYNSKPNPKPEHLPCPDSYSYNHKHMYQSN